MLTQDTDDASLAQLENRVTRVALRVELGIAELKTGANLPSGDVGQRRTSRQINQRRRKSSVVEELARQLQQLTDHTRRDACHSRRRDAR
jgi:hypothetical protein